MGKGNIGFISGRRIAGDIGPNGVDYVTNAPGRVFAPAVRITNTDQFYNEVSAVQNYVLGSKMFVDDRIFRYSRAGGALVAPCTYRLQTDGEINAPTTWGMTSAGITINTSTIVVTPGAGYGVPPNSIALNELAGGYIEFWGAANAFAWRKIVSNTAIAVGVPATTTIVVDRPWDFTQAGAAGQVALHRSAYRNVIMAGSVPALVAYESAVGLTPVPVGAGSYFWLQTAGPCYVASQIGNPGAVVNFRDVYLGAAGTVASFNLAYAAGANVSPQRVGFIRGGSTNADGNNDVMLQLDQ
jgi:hypothetical protein